MSDVITAVDVQSRILKDESTFAVLNPHGDVDSLHEGEEGLYHQDTRHLSHYQMRIGNFRPLLLNSKVRRDNSVLSIDMTNPAVGLHGQRPLEQAGMHIFRSLFLWSGVCYERVKIRSYSAEPIEFLLQYTFDSDFADIFEVRGQRRRHHGERLKTEVGDNRIVLAYRGLDDRTRATILTFENASHISPTSASHQISLEPGAVTSRYVMISCNAEPQEARRRSFASCMRQARKALQTRRASGADIHTSNELFNEWLNRSAADLYMLLASTEHGPYPFAGTPWFCCPFGRDGIITALQCLWANPGIARGVLGYLAATQATEEILDQEAEPGKILHERRRGEMAALKEVPFGFYYGSVDATPLFIVLAGAYYARTGDRDFVGGIWPNIEAALRWIDTYGDIDGDGFVEYRKKIPTGLVNQGWKDSDDSVSHADGRLAQGPIALCEVQAYVYEAKRQAAELAASLGRAARAASLREEALRLREQFERLFWCEELSTYGLALDGDKRLCRVRASNAGHALFCGIASSEHAARTAETLMHFASFSAWGIRTLAASERRYNPMSYHNGSIWPHDNALIALGFARYGLTGPVMRLLSGMFNASIYMDLHRLPELFCGFDRRASEGPVLYPTACAPQAWACTTVTALLAACLGISFDPQARQVCFDRPILPPFLDELRLRNIEIGDGSVDLMLRRHPHDVSVNITERRGRADVRVTK